MTDNLRSHGRRHNSGGRGRGARAHEGHDHHGHGGGNARGAKARAPPRGPSSMTRQFRNQTDIAQQLLYNTIRAAQHRLSNQLNIPVSGLSRAQFKDTVKTLVYDLQAPIRYVPEGHYGETFFNDFWKSKGPRGHIKKAKAHLVARDFCAYVLKRCQRLQDLGEIVQDPFGNASAPDKDGDIKLFDSDYSDVVSDWGCGSFLTQTDENGDLELTDDEPEPTARGVGFSSKPLPLASPSLPNEFGGSSLGLCGRISQIDSPFNSVSGDPWNDQSFGYSNHANSPNVEAEDKLIASLQSQAWSRNPVAEPSTNHQWIDDGTPDVQTRGPVPAFPQQKHFGATSLSSFGIPTMDPTPTVSKFLDGVNSLIGSRDGAELQSYLLIEPPFANIYNQMISELRQAHPRTEPADGQWATIDPQLEMKCGSKLPIASMGVEDVTWGAFTKFMAQYLSYIRDVDGNDIKGAYDLLSELVGKTNGALSSSAFGEIILPTAVSYCKTLTSFSIVLDKRNDIPRLIGEDGSSESLPERAANTVRIIFTTCLNDRTPLKDGRPEGKKAAIYTIANTCLKVLFAAKKVGATEQIFNNIQNASPPLSLYPAAERVTYLYYLGRFHFSTGHHYRAALALQSALDQTLPAFTKQRRAILIYLITCNITLGRFPTPALYALPEARGLASKFSPITDAIRTGHTERLARCTSLALLNNPSLHPPPPAQWLFAHALLLPLRRAASVLAQRSLLRRLCILFADSGDATANRPPSLDLAVPARLFAWLVVRAHRPQSAVAHEPVGKRNLNHIFQAAESRAPEDFGAIVWPKDRFVHVDLQTPPESPPGYQPGFQPGFLGNDKSTPPAQNKPPLPDVVEIEAIVASLMQQGLLIGYMTHKGKKLALAGAKREGGALRHAFPQVYSALVGRCDADVPGWKGDEPILGPFGGQKFGPGMVVNLSGARPAGS